MEEKEAKIPTEAERAATANVLRNIANLLKGGLFFGHNAGYVQEALGWLENSSNNLSPPPAVAKAETKKAVRKLKRVKNG